MTSTLNPLQLWLPTFTSSLERPGALRDMRRAFEYWGNEEIVWMLPDIDHVTRWRDEEGLSCVAVPSERIERIEVYHIGGNRRVVGPANEDRFPAGTIETLLDVCLSWNQIKFDLFRTPRSITLGVPVLKTVPVTYQARAIFVTPHSYAPIVSMDDVTAEFTASWCPKVKGFSSISPDSESEQEHGPFRYSELRGHTIAIGARSNVCSLPLIARWPEPLTHLVPSGDGLDLGYAWHKAKEIARQSTESATLAFDMAQRSSEPYVSEGTTNRELSWYGPTYAAGGEKAVLFGAEDFGIQESSLEALRKNPEFAEVLSQSVKIKRAWGPQGLIWALLMQQLEAGQVFGKCLNCSRIMVGKKGKMYCDRSDNEKCFKSRRARDKRTSRSRRM